MVNAQESFEENVQDIDGVVFIEEVEIKWFTDFKMAKALVIEFKFGVDEKYNIKELKKEYDFVVIATGSWNKWYNPFKTGGEKVIEALDFLEKSKKNSLKTLVRAKDKKGKAEVLFLEKGDYVREIIVRASADSDKHVLLGIKTNITKEELATLLASSKDKEASK